MPPDDLGFTPDAEPAPQQAAQSAPAPQDDGLGFVAEGAKPQDDGLGFTPEAVPQSSTLGAAVEGTAKGVISRPLTAAAELGLSKLGVPGMSAQDQEQRAQEHPYVEGGFEAAGMIAPMLLTAGMSTEAKLALEGGSLAADAAKGASTVAKIAKYATAPGLIGMAGNATAKSLGLSKYAAAGVNMAIQSGLFHTADNASKMILGQTDPEAPVASLVAGLPRAMALGTGLGVGGEAVGAGLKAIANSKASKAFSQFAADFGNGFKTMNENPDPVAAAAEEAQHLYETSSSAMDGGFSLKRDAIEKLTGEIDPATTSAYVNGLRSTLSNLPKNLKTNGVIQDAIADWEKQASPTIDPTNPFAKNSPSAADVFEATDGLKKRIQEIAFAEKYQNGIMGRDLARNASALQGNIKTSLENPGMWGDMGKFQKELNSAYSGLQAPTADFESAVTGSSQTNGARVDSDKVRGLIKKIVMEQGSLKQSKVLDYIPKAKAAIQAVDDLHSSMGLESGLPKVSTNTLDEMMSNTTSNGLKAARALFTKGPGSIGWAAAHTAGTAIGGAFGQPYLGFRATEQLAPIFSKVLGNKVTRWGVAGLMRAMAAGEYAGVPAVENYTKRIGQGADAIENATKSIFTAGGKSLNSDFSESDREKLKKNVETGVQDQQIQNQGKPAPAPQAPQAFAHGGEVLAPELPKPDKKHAGKVLDGMGHISTVFPEQGMLLGATKGRVNNYLNSIRPQTMKPKLPFDEHMPDKEHDRAYNRALDIANKPLSVLDHIKNGTLAPEHMQHMQGMYPELTSHLQKKLTEKITEAQMKNEKPPHKVRQGLSLFMGAALDANLTPQNIMAAQATFAAQGAQQMPQGAPKKNTDKLTGLADQHRTTEQSAIQRQDRSKV